MKIKDRILQKFYRGRSPEERAKRANVIYQEYQKLADYSYLLEQREEPIVIEVLEKARQRILKERKEFLDDSEIEDDVIDEVTAPDFRYSVGSKIRDFGAKLSEEEVAQANQKILFNKLGEETAAEIQRKLRRLELEVHGGFSWANIGKTERPDYVKFYGPKDPLRVIFFENIPFAVFLWEFRHLIKGVITASFFITVFAAAFLYLYKNL